MTNCIHCEITRAKFKVKVLRSVGWSLSHLAQHLSDCYGETYYSENGNLYRKSKLPPYVDHLIYESKE